MFAKSVAKQCFYVYISDRSNIYILFLVQYLHVFSAENTITRQLIFRQGA